VRGGRLLAEVAASVDAPPKLTPVLAELFADLGALGSMPRRVAGLLERAGVGSRARVIDLACGKGAVAVEVAERIGCRVVGVDAFGPFVEAAREAARGRGVDGLCRFTQGDVRAARGRFDAGMMIGLFPLERAAAVLRGLVKRGGVYVIDDVFRDARAPGAARFVHIPTRAECRAMLVGDGDEVVEVAVPRREEIARLNAGLFRGLQGRAAAVSRRRPELWGEIREFLKRQRRANTELVGALRPAIWVVRRGG